MFDELINLVKEQAGSSIINNPAIPNENNDAAINEASSSVMDGLKNAVQNGNISSITNLFNGSHSANTSPLSENIQSDLMQRLMTKFGLNSSQAGNVAGSLIPTVLSKLIHKTNDPTDTSFNMKNILESIGGSSGSGFDLGSLINKITGSNTAQSTQQPSQGGGLMDELKNLL